MAAYIIASVEVTDSVLFADYGKQVPAVVAAHGGRYLVRGPGAEVLEGDASPHRLVVIEFPDMASLKAFYHSAQYKPLLAMRNRAAKSKLFAIEGV